LTGPTLIISEMTRDRAIITIDGQKEVIYAMSNGGISNYLDGPGPLTRFQSHVIFEVEYLQTVKVTIAH